MQNYVAVGQLIAESVLADCAKKVECGGWTLRLYADIINLIGNGVAINHRFRAAAAAGDRAACDRLRYDSRVKIGQLEVGGRIEVDLGVLICRQAARFEDYKRNISEVDTVGADVDGIIREDEKMPLGRHPVGLACGEIVGVWRI